MIWIPLDVLLAVPAAAATTWLITGFADCLATVFGDGWSRLATHLKEHRR